MKKSAFILLICILPLFSHAEELMISKKDYLAFIIGNYVHGFKEFETSVVGFEESASIGIHYDLSTQSRKRAEQLAGRFRREIPEMLKSYPWANNVKIVVSLHVENRSGRDR